MFKDKKEGTTHSYNDGCGEPAHNSPLLTIINDGDKLFDEFTIAVPWELDENIHFVDATPEEIRNFIHSRELALVEGLKARYEGMKKEIRKGQDIYEMSDNDSYNSAFSLAIAELDEAITHLKK